MILRVEAIPSDIGLTKRALAKSHVTNQRVVAKDGQDALDDLFGAGTGREDVTQVPTLGLRDLPGLNARQENSFGGLAP
jgi:two-component system, response regulator